MMRKCHIALTQQDTRVDNGCLCSIQKNEESFSNNPINNETIKSQEIEVNIVWNRQEFILLIYTTIKHPNITIFYTFVGETFRNSLLLMGICILAYLAWN